MHQSFVSTAPPPPPPTAMGGDNDFHFPEPWYKSALWGQADGNNPALCPSIHNRKSQQGKCPNFITPTLPRHCGDNQKVIIQQLTPAIPRQIKPNGVAFFSHDGILNRLIIELFLTHRVKLKHL